MELDQLKDMWKEQEADQSPQEVQPILGRKSNTPIAKMKRHLMAELIAVVVGYGLVIVYFLLMNGGKFYSVAILYLVIGALFCVYFYKKFKLLKEMECMACQVKSNLSKQVNTLEKYTRFYLFAGTAIIPIVLIFFYWFENTYLTRDRIDVFLQPSNTVSIFQSLLALAMVIIPITIIFYFVNKWYIRKLYGNYIGKLKSMLSQMEDNTAS
jgi:hypothetical protein